MEGIVIKGYEPYDEAVRRLAQELAAVRAEVEGLRAELEQARKKAAQMERERDEAVLVYRQYLAHMDDVTKDLHTEIAQAEARAKAAEAELAQCNVKRERLLQTLEREMGRARNWELAAQQRLERAEAAEAALELLRRVAEAVRKDGSLTPMHLQAWAGQNDKQLGYEGSILSVWLREVADALAALDAARGQEGENNGTLATEIMMP